MVLLRPGSTALGRVRARLISCAQHSASPLQQATLLRQQPREDVSSLSLTVKEATTHQPWRGLWRGAGAFAVRHDDGVGPSLHCKELSSVYSCRGNEHEYRYGASAQATLGLSLSLTLAPPPAMAFLTDAQQATVLTSEEQQTVDLFKNVTPSVVREGSCSWFCCGNAVHGGAPRKHKDAGARRLSRAGPTAAPSHVSTLLCLLVAFRGRQFSERGGYLSLTSSFFPETSAEVG